VATGILVNSEGRVDTTTFLEETTDSETGTLGGNENDINT
jgi:hypothetical protein